MFVNKINLINFRSYDTFNLDIEKGTNIIIGNNGVGKTTIIESLYYLSLSKSFKSKDKYLINTNSDFFTVTCSLSNNNKLLINYNKEQKICKINNKKISKISEYINKFKVILFSPEDLELIKNDPDTRRKFLDIEISKLSNTYFLSLSNYKKNLLIRNKLLKEKNVDKILVQQYTDILIKESYVIVKERKKFIETLNIKTLKYFQEISSKDENLELLYKMSVEDNFEEMFDANWQNDIQKQTTTKGVHRDELVININNTLAKNIASQGQIRSIVIAIKLALVDYIYETHGEYPVLLLDDILSELDKERQNNLMMLLNKSNQTIITTTNIKDIETNIAENANIIEIGVK